VDAVSKARPDWQFVFVGPVTKIDPGSLPHAPNIHYLGGRTYDELPSYLSGWDVALLPFAHNESTRFISPTKTPEYLAAGLPVVSTRIRDVVRPYEELGLVRIADTAEQFVEAAERAMATADMTMKWRERADEFLKSCSWDSVWDGMNRLVNDVTTGSGKEQAEKTLAARPEVASV